jgi:hypothetical protein
MTDVTATFRPDIAFRQSLACFELLYPRPILGRSHADAAVASASYSPGCSLRLCRPIPYPLRHQTLVSVQLHTSDHSCHCTAHVLLTSHRILPRCSLWFLYRPLCEAIFAYRQQCQTRSAALPVCSKSLHFACCDQYPEGRARL